MANWQTCGNSSGLQIQAPQQRLNQNSTNFVHVACCLRSVDKLSWVPYNASPHNLRHGKVLRKCKLQLHHSNDHGVHYLVMAVIKHSLRTWEILVRRIDITTWCHFTSHRLTGFVNPGNTPCFPGNCSVSILIWASNILVLVLHGTPGIYCGKKLDVNKTISRPYCS